MTAQMEPTKHPTAPPAPRRTLWSLLLVLCSLWLGLVAGTAIGGLFVPEGSGLAGPAIALGYGVMGALAGLALAIVFALKLPVRPLRLSALIALLLSALAVLLMGYRVVRQQRSSLALHLDAPVERAPALVVVAGDRPRLSQADGFEPLRFDSSLHQIVHNRLGSPF